MGYYFTLVGGPLLPPLPAKDEKEVLTRLKVNNDPTLHIRNETKGSWVLYTYKSSLCFSDSTSFF